MTLRKLCLHAARVALAGILVSGCASQTAQWSGVEPVKRNRVDLVRLPHDVTFASGSNELAAAEAEKLQTFLDSVGFDYGDRLALDIGTAPSGSVSATASARADAVRRHLVRLGHEVEPKTIDHGVSPGPDAVRVIVERHVVTPPACPDWRQPASPNYNNAPTSNLGCASVTALGMMVADPRDLVEGAAFKPSDAGVTTRGIQNLKADEVKWRPDGKAGTSITTDSK